MRDIKFRAWDNKAEQLYNSDYIETYTIGALRDDRYHLMQYTGLKDKNGNEIYEGDIVQKPPVESYFPMVVKYGHPTVKLFGSTYDYVGFYFAVNGNNDEVEAWGATYDSEYTEVVGNIYENPELLEKAS